MILLDIKMPKNCEECPCLRWGEWQAFEKSCCALDGKISISQSRTPKKCPLKRTKQQKTEWIPVSKRLPDEDGYYLGTCGDDTHSIVVDSFSEGRFNIYNVIAWMPLLDPWKEGDADDRNRKEIP